MLFAIKTVIFFVNCKIIKISYESN